MQSNRDCQHSVYEFLTKTEMFFMPQSTQSNKI